MDTALQKNGEFAVDEAGKMYPVSGTEERLQQGWIALNARRGAFWYDPELGSDLRWLTGEEERLAAAREALGRVPGLEVSGIVTDGEEEAVEVICSGERFRIPIKEGENG